MDRTRQPWQAACLGEGDPDRKPPGPPGWGLALGPATQCRKKHPAKIPKGKASDNSDGTNGKRQWKRKRTIIFGTWNVQSLTNKKMEVFKEISKANLDIVILTETKLKGKGQEMVGSYLHIWSGIDKSKRAAAGVSILLKSKLKNSISASKREF